MDKEKEKEKGKDTKALKSKLRQLDSSLKKDVNNPISSVRNIEKLMKELEDPTDERAIYFISKLNEFVKRLMSNSNYDDSIVLRINTFFQRVISYVLLFIPYDSEEAVSLLFFLLNPKKNAFYSEYGGNIEINSEEENYMGHFEDESGLLILNVNHFMIQHGPSIIDKRISNKENRVPFNIFYTLIHVIYKIYDLLHAECSEQVIEIIWGSVEDYFFGLSEDEIKNLDKKSIESVLDLCYSFLIHLDKLRQEEHEQDANEKIDLLKLEISLKCLQAPFLNKKIDGILEICEICKQHFIESGSSEEDSRPPAVDERVLAKWLQERKVLEYLFGSGSPHIEVIKRCGEILSFLAAFKKIGKQQIDLIYSSSLNQHESIKHQIWRLMRNVLRYLDKPIVDYLFDKIQKIPLAEYDYQLLCFIEAITHMGYHLDLQVGKNLYGVELIWNAMQDTAGKKHEFVINSVGVFENLIERNYCDKNDILSKCMKNLKQNISVPQSLVLVKTILSRYPGVHEVLASKEEDNLFELYFKHLVYYSKLVLDKKNASAIEKLDEYIFVGKYNHTDYLNILFDFLEFILRKSSRKWSDEEMDTFWDCVVLNAITDSSRDIAFEWLLNGSLKDKTGGQPTLGLKEIRYIFDKKIPTLNLENLSMAGYTLLENYFMSINNSQNNIVSNQRSFVVTNYDLFGIDYLWKIAVESENIKVGDAAIELINRIQNSPDASLQNQILKHRQNFLDRCMTYLNDIAKQVKVNTEETQSRKLQTMIKKTFRLMKNFIDSFDGNNEIKKHGHDKRGIDIELKVRIVTTKSEYYVRTHTKENVANLRSLIYQNFRPEKTEKLVSLSQFRLQVNEMDLMQDSVLLKDLNLHNHDLIKVYFRTPSINKILTEEDKKILPVTLLSEDKYFNQFFQLFDLLPDAGCTEVWDLLEKLSTNERIKQNILSEDASPGKWETIFDSHNTYQLYYTLQIIETIIDTRSEDRLDTVVDRDTSPQGKSEWCTRFVQSGGLKCLFDIFLKKEFIVTNRGTMSFVCVALLLKIINYFTISKEDQPKLLPVFYDMKIPETTLLKKVLELTTKSCLPENIRSEPISSEGSKNLSETDHIFTYAMPLFSSLCQSKEGAKEFFENFFDSWLDGVLFSNPLSPSRAAVSVAIYQICSSSTSENLWILKQSISKLLDFLPQLKIQSSVENKYMGYCSEYFQLLIKLIGLAQSYKELSFPRKHNYTKVVVSESMAKERHLDLVFEIIEMLEGHPIIELTSQSPDDLVLIGLLDLLRTLVSCDQSGNLKLYLGPFLIPLLLRSCVFSLPTLHQPAPHPPLCKSSNSRKSVFSLLLELSKQCLVNSMYIAKNLLEFQRKNRKNSLKLWDYNPKDLEKSVDFVGLENQGCTCYLNSLVQQIFMVNQFRFRLFQVEEPKKLVGSDKKTEVAESDNAEVVPKTDQKEDKFEESILYQLQSLFANLQESEKKFVDTRHLTKSYKVDGKSINPSEQQDVDEFFAHLFDRLETSLKGTTQEKLLKQLFGGTIVYQILSKECDHKSERSENCFTLPLEVKNKRKITDSLDLFVQGDMLDGDNKYFCEKCQNKVTALRRSCIGKLPNNLIIHLKRFDFDLELMARNKLNSYCEFTNRINLEPYTTEGLERKEKIEAGEVPPEPLHPLSYYEYVLTGILVHSGTTESGHYYSFVSDKKTGKWWEFNDTEISPFNPEYIPYHCFGGVESQYFWDQTRGCDVIRNVDKHYSAYMLFYERVEFEDVPKTVEFNESQSKLIPKDLYNKVWEKNVKFIIDKSLFDSDYYDYIHNFLNLFNLTNTEDAVATIQPSYLSLLLIELGTFFFIHPLSHSISTSHAILPVILERLKTMYLTDTTACQWFIQSLYKARTTPELFSAFPEPIDAKFTELGYGNRYDIFPSFYYEAVDGSSSTKSSSSSSIGWVVEMLLLNDESKVRKMFVDLIGHVAKILDNKENTLYGTYAEVSKEKRSKTKKSKGKKTDKGKKLMTKAAATPNSHIERLLDYLLSLTRELKKNWQNAKHYYLLIKILTDLSPALRKLMISKGLIAYFIHIFLNEDSPYADSKKTTNNSSDDEKELKKNAEICRTKKHLLEAISLLIRTIPIPRENQQNSVGDSPSSLKGESNNFNSTEDKDFACSDKYLFKALEHDVNTSVVTDIILHLTWENLTYSKKMLDMICRALNKFPHSKFRPYLTVLDNIFMLKDSLEQPRIEHGLYGYINLILENLKWKRATKKAVSRLVKFSANPFVLHYLKDNLESWVSLLYYFTSDRSRFPQLVRFNIEYLFLEMVPEVPGYEISLKKNKKLTPSSFGKEVQSYDPKNLHQVQEVLLSELKNISSLPYEIAQTEKDTEVLYSEVETLSYQFYSYFRLLSWTLQSETEKNQFDKTDQFYLSKLLKQTEEKRYPNDHNKLAILSFMEKLTRKMPGLIERFGNDVSIQAYFRGDFPLYCVQAKKYEEYNTEVLSLHYKLFWRFFKSCEAFFDATVDTLNWTFKYFLLESVEFPLVTKIATKIFEYQVPTETKIVIPYLVSIIPSKSINWITFKQLIDKYLVTKGDMVLFFSQRGFSAIAELVIKKNYAFEERGAMLAVLEKTCSWFTDPNLNQKEQNIRASELTAFKALVRTLITLFRNIRDDTHLEQGKTIINILRIGIASLDVGTTVLESLSIYFKEKELIWPPRQLYWFKELSPFVLETCKTLFRTKETTQIFQLVLRIAHESVGCPKELFFPVVSFLIELWDSHSPQNVIKVFNTTFCDLLLKMIIKYYDNCLDEDSEILKLAQPVISQVRIILKNFNSNLKKEFISFMNKKISSLEEKCEANDDPEIIQEIILLLSISQLFKDEPDFIVALQNSRIIPITKNKMAEKSTTWSNHPNALKLQELTNQLEYLCK